MINRRRAARLRIYLDEDDQIGHRPAYVAVVELLRWERAAGATVLRGVEGFGATGVVHTVNLGDLVEKLPVVIEWIDTPEQVERLLPKLEQMLPHGLVTLDETDVVIAASGQHRTPGGQGA